MKCSAVRSHIPRLHDGEIEARVAGEVRAHLIDCADCRRGMSAVHGLANRLGELPMAVPAPGFQTRVMARIVAGDLPRRPEADLLSFVRGIAAAAALVLGMGSLFLASEADWRLPKAKGDALEASGLDEVDRWIWGDLVRGKPATGPAALDR